ncbi:MAG: AarF/UbiB family protein [Acidimicrobiales bacterium]|nr:AarF/UbiB family protein [Acidimicrobiales bacterium]
MSDTFDPSTIPLPDVRELIRWSAWVDEIPGLRAEAERLVAAVPRRREELARQARRLARPQVDAAMLSSIATVGGRVAMLAVADLNQPRGSRRRSSSGAQSGEPQRVSRGERNIRRAQQLVRAGGPAWVKLGQFIATTQGLLPDEWVDAFAWCRDEVPALPFEVVERTLSASFGRPISRLFAAFDETPIAAASIAQVHRAELLDGREVVVKVRRPGLRQRFARDIRAMAGAARVSERVSAIARTGNLSGFVELFAQLVLEELDFHIEAANMLELGITAEHAGADFVRIPRPIPGMVRERVLVMEGMPGRAYTAADLSAVDRERLLQLAIQGVLEHTLVYGVFHGDLHAGNVLLDDDGTFSLVDFGIVGRLDQAQRAALVRFLVGFARNDVMAQLEAMVSFGAIPPGADLADLARAIETEIDPEHLPEDASAAQLAEAVGTLIRLVARRGFRLPEELVLFFKNLLYLNGFAAAVAPDANLLKQIDPVFGYFTQKYGGAVDLFTQSLPHPVAEDQPTTKEQTYE